MSDHLSQDLASLRIEKPVQQPRSTSGRLWPLALLGLGGVAYVVVDPSIAAMFSSLRAAQEPAQPTAPSSEHGAPLPGQERMVASGYVAPLLTSKVGAKLEGRIEQVFIREGDVVKRGDPLFALDTTKQQTLIAAARARLAAARAHVERHRVGVAETTRRLEREQALLDAGVATRADVDDLRGQVQVQRQTLAAARADLTEAQAKLDELIVDAEFRTIRAPIDGTVTSNPADLGEAVAPILPALVELADFSSLVVEVDVPEARLAGVEIGGPCTIVLDAYPDLQYEGAVMEIGPVVNRAKATVTTRIRFVSSHEGVLPNMAARVSFLAAHAPSVEGRPS